MTGGAEVIEVPVVGRWAERAACRHHPTDWWFPDKRQGPDCYRLARQVCATCPVRDACHDHAVNAPEIRGMWGGRTPMQLRADRVAAARRKEEGVARDA